MASDRDYLLDELTRLTELYGGYDNELGERDDDMGMHDNGETTVTVKKDELLTVVKKNRDSHRATFLEAQKGYREEVIKTLDKTLAEVREGRPFVQRNIIDLVMPSEHTKDYDRVIRMLEMSVASEITITEGQFSQYVLDDWGWKANFVATSSRYSR